MRNINDILLFRNDIAPFLTHLTKPTKLTDNTKTAKQNLENIFKSKKIKQSGEEISIAKYGVKTGSMSTDKKKSLFSAICFTETPLNEIHNLLEIPGRKVDLTNYGLVLIKEKLIKKYPVNPVFYLNNTIDKERNDIENAFYKMCNLMLAEDTEGLDRIMPLFSVFGYKLTSPGAKERSSDSIDFLWEREWRLPYTYGDIDLDPEMIFVGLCPDEEIDEFETFSKNYFYQGCPDKKILFVDPQRNLKWYANKLIEARQRVDIKFSVI